ncbi:MAG: hypothetical protein C4345_13950, partial [Chloroflexota bacterium]
VRMREISMIPQGAMNSLNPVMRIKDQLIDGMRAHGEQGSDAVLARRAGEVLESVGLARAAADMFPHQLSGGMKQRVCIAIAIALRPKIIIADEPTSALDVVTQRQVMETIGQVQQRLGSSVVLIGHDMGLMAQFVDRLADPRELQGAAPPLHPAPDQYAACAGGEGRVQGHSRAAALAARRSARLRLPSSLPQGHGGLYPRDPGAPGSPAGPPGSLPSLPGETAGRTPGGRTRRGEAMTTLLELRNVTKVFGGGLFQKHRTVAVDNLSLTIEDEPPSILAVVGESGSGKTTLGLLLLGFHAP